MSAAPVPRAGRAGRAGPGILVREALANVRAWRALAILLAVAAAGLGGFVSWSSASTVDRNVRAAAELDDAGRQVLRLIGVDGPLPAAACESLRGIDTVAAAYGVGPISQARLSTGALVTVQQATAGIARYLGVQDRDRVESWVLTGATLSEREGLIDDGWLAFGPVAPDGLAGRVVTTERLEARPRTQNLDDSVIISLMPDQEADECRVEPVAGARPALVVGLTAVVSGIPVRVLPLREDIEIVDEPERRMRAVPGDLATFGAGGVLAVLVLGWWFVRRSEWALYRTFGLGVWGIAALAVVEWLVVCGVPLGLGGLWGLALVTPGSVDLGYTVALLNLGSSTLVASVAVGLWVGYARIASAALALRGI